MTHEPGIREAQDRLRAGGRLLVTRLRYMGDAILTLPLLSFLRQAFPAAELHYLAEAPTLEMLREQPEIDVRWSARRGVAPTLGLLRALRTQRFAAAIDLFSNPRSALLVGLCGAPLRIGEARRVRRHAYTWARRLEGRNALEHHLNAVRGLGVEPPPASRPRLALTDAERAAGEARWRASGSAPGVLLHLAASHPAKEWPVRNAVELVRALESEGVPVLLSSAPHRPELSAEVAERADATPRLLPPLPLRQMLGVLATAGAVVSVDGAVVHAGVALGRPTLALFGPTDPVDWFPYAGFGPYRVLHAGLDCSRCDRERCAARTCMAALEPSAVLHELRALWQRAPAPAEAP